MATHPQGTLRVAAFVACALLLAACGGPQSRLASHMQRGQSYLADGNYAKASIEFRNAMLIDPKSPAARVMAGRAAEGLGRIRDAAGLYQSVVDTTPDNVEARVGLARVMVLGGASQRAIDIVTPGLAKHPDDPGLLTYRAAARMRLKDTAGALADVQHALKVAPGDIEAISLRASMYRNAGDPQGAIALVSKILATPPAGAAADQLLQLRVVLVELYEGTGDLPSAQQQLRTLISLKPERLSYRLQLARSLDKAGRTDDAQLVLEEAVKALPHDNQVKFALAGFLAEHRTKADGERLLSDAIAREPDNYELALGLADLQLRDGSRDAALATFRDVIKRAGTDPAGVTARERLAAIYMQQGRDAEARGLVAEVLQQSPHDDVALTMHSQMAMAAGDSAGAISDLRGVLRDQPDDAGVHRMLAHALLAHGDFALATESFRAALERAPGNNSLRVELAQQLVKSGDARQAVALLEPAVHDAPADPALREELVRAYLASGDNAAAATGAENLKTLRPDSPAGFYLAGVVAERLGRPDDAAREMQHALAIEPHAADALAALVELELARHQPDRALTAARDVASRAPADAFPLNLLGELYIAQHKLPEGIASLTRATQLDPGWAVPYENLGVAKLLTGDTVGAIAAYQAGIKAAPREPALPVGLAQLYERHGQVDDAIATYKDWHTRNPQVARVSANLALLLVTYRKDRSSLDQARDLSASFDASSDAGLLDTDGWVHFKRAEYQQAVPVLERALAQAPDSNEIHYHLGMVELQMGNSARARSELETALTGATRFAGADDARNALASLKHQAG
jgi:Flp pilus assembly protein TadD